jgi:guanosine-3',5'-bis(diphosphate) 3'-pyrophosphohydrolase
LRFSGNRTQSELLIDIGLGKRIATIVAKRLVTLLAEETGEKPDALLLTRERFTAQDSLAQGAWHSMAARTLRCIIRPVADRSRVMPSSGIWGVGKAWWFTRPPARSPASCRTRTASGSLPSTGPTSPYGPSRPTSPRRSSTAKACWRGWPRRWPMPEADITHIDMGQDGAQEATDLRFVIAVRDRAHLETALRNLRRTRVVCCAPTEPSFYAGPAGAG